MPAFVAPSQLCRQQGCAAPAQRNLAAKTRGHGVMVFAINPGLVRTTMSESALSCGEPSIEQWFTDAFAGQEDVSTNACPPPGRRPGGRVFAGNRPLAA